MLLSLILRLRDWHLDGLACLAASAASAALGKFSRVTLVDRMYWVHEQGGRYFVELLPSYRLDGAELEALTRDVFFHAYLPRDGDLCVDVGAGIGTETRLMSELIGWGSVFSIEASPSTFRALELSCELNGLQNVTTHQYAISDRNGTIGIMDNPDAHAENSIVRKNDGQATQVQSLTIDEYLTRNRIDAVDYMKINIEGAERLLIQSFRRINTVRHIAISCHDFLGRRLGDDGLFTKEPVMQFLTDKGFEIVTRTTNVDYKDDWVYGTNLAFLES